MTSNNVPYGREIFKTPLVLQLWFLFNQTFLNFLTRVAYWTLENQISVFNYNSARLCQQSYSRGATVHRPSDVRWLPISQKSLYGSKSNFMHNSRFTISPHNFCLFVKFSIFTFLWFFFSFSLKWAVWKQKLKTFFQFLSDLRKLYKKSHEGLFKVINFLGDLPKSKTFMTLWNFG